MSLNVNPTENDDRHRGIELCRQGRYAQAIPLLRRAQARAPGPDEAVLRALSEALLNQGKVAESIGYMDRVLAVRPDDPTMQSARLVWSYFDPELNDEQIMDRHLRWASKTEPTPESIQPHANLPDPDRPLKIGYISSTFRSHITMALLGPVLELHDRSKFDIACYDNTANPDEITQQAKRFVSGWRDIRNLDDEDAAVLIRHDGVDILVDLELHLPPNRIRLLARKPAPLQGALIQYPGTSGLRAMDFVCADRHMITPGCARYFTEQLIPLETLWIFRERGPARPQEEPAFRIVPPPVLKNGFITFGSMNNAPKLNRPLQLVWRQILDAVPNSRLLIQVKGSTGGQVELLQECGLVGPRVEVIDSMSPNAYVQQFQRVDIALDPFPYGGGGGTGFETLWAGVPLITLAGDRPTARYGTSLLSNIGLTEFIAHTPQQYMQIAVDLAGQPKRLAELRSSMRSRMQKSVVMDEPRYVRRLEQAYRKMWKSWCARNRRGQS
jgi:predicted O-linked N-acetylglucosamine transferase (SPINDLY family)